MSEPSTTLTDTLTLWRERAASAAAMGDRRGAQLVAAVLDDIERAAAPLTERLSETEARLRTGRSLKWLRGQFPAWQRAGHAWRAPGGRRQYRACVLPPPRGAGVTRARAAREADAPITAGADATAQARGALDLIRARRRAS